jgi:hypothetical protein
MRDRNVSSRGLEESQIVTSLEWTWEKETSLTEGYVEGVMYAVAEGNMARGILTAGTKPEDRAHQ